MKTPFPLVQSWAYRACFICIWGSEQLSSKPIRFHSQTAPSVYPSFLPFCPGLRDQALAIHPQYLLLYSKCICTCIEQQLRLWKTWSLCYTIVQVTLPMELWYRGAHVLFHTHVTLNGSASQWWSRYHITFVHWVVRGFLVFESSPELCWRFLLHVCYVLLL